MNGSGNSEIATLNRGGQSILVDLSSRLLGSIPKNDGLIREISPSDLNGRAA